MTFQVGQMTIDVPDCKPSGYAHWYEIGPYQFGLVIGGLLLLVGLLCVIVAKVTS